MKINFKDLVSYLYSISVLYMVNFGGITTALLSNTILNLLMLIVYVTIPIVLLIKNGIRIKKKYAFVFLFLLCMFGMCLDRTAWSVINILRYLGVFLLFLLILKDKSIVNILLKLLLFCSIIYGVFTFVEFFNRGFYTTYIYVLFDDTAGNLANAFKSGYMAGLTNHYSSNAMFLSIGVIISATRFFSEKKRINAYVLIFIFLSLLLTGKRGPLLFTILSLYITFYNSINKKSAANKFTKFVGVTLIIVCIGAIVINYVPALSVAFYRLKTLASDDDTSSAVRLQLWQLAIRGFMNKPILGNGWYQFEKQFSYLVGGNRTFNVHNVYLQLLCDNGLIGFTLYVSWFIKSIILTHKTYVNAIKQNEDKERINLLSFSFCFQLFFLMYCFTGNPLYDWKMNIPYFIACGITHFYYYSKGKSAFMR